MPSDWSRPVLFVSCQAGPRTPLDHPETIARVAQAAVSGGAFGLRVNSPSHVAAVRNVLPTTPIIGIWKIELGTTAVRITPSLAAAEALVEAGSSIVAVDATLRPRPGLPSVRELIDRVSELGVEVMADVDSRAAAEAAVAAGASLIATTLAGYTEARPRTRGPDLALVSELSGLGVPVVAEGRYASPDEVRAAIDLGAQAVVVGTAITDPIALTACFCQALK